MQMGYTFAIHDPLRKGERLEAHDPDGSIVKDIIYVGFSRVPWVSIQRLILEPPNSDFKEYLTKVYGAFPTGLVIPGVEVLNAYYGEIDGLPYDVLQPDDAGRAYIEWTVLEEISAAMVLSMLEHQGEGRNVLDKNSKAEWVDKLKSQGHPLLNRKPGRPTGSKTERRKVIAVGDLIE